MTRSCHSSLDRPNRSEARSSGSPGARPRARWHEHLPSLAGWDGFDTFEGLPEPWTHGGVTVMEQGVFAPAKGEPSFPVVDAKNPVVWYKGLIADTICELSTR